MEEKCPPGTRIERIHPSTNILDLGTVMDIPVYTDSPDSSGNYSDTILFDNGTTSALPLLDMASIIPTPPVQEEDSTNTNCLLPPFLQLNSKITYDHAGQFHKGFLGIHNGVYRFVLAMLPIISVGVPHCRRLLPSTPLPLLLASSTCIGTAHHLSSKPWLIPITIVKYAFKVITRRSAGLRVLTCIAKLSLASIPPFVKKGLLSQSPPCVF